MVSKYFGQICAFILLSGRVSKTLFERAWKGRVYQAVFTQGADGGP
jgi:ATP/ADP translocase